MDEDDFELIGDDEYAIIEDEYGYIHANGYSHTDDLCDADFK